MNRITTSIAVLALAFACAKKSGNEREQLAALFFAGLSGHTNAGVRIDVSDRNFSERRLRSVGLRLPATKADVVRVTVTVMRGSDTLIDARELTENAGVWLGTLEFLPLGTELNFIGYAYDAADVVIFSGVTTTTLADGDGVTIRLAPLGDGESIKLPRVAQILRPEEFFGQKVEDIDVIVEGQQDKSLEYEFLSEVSNTGIFLPSSGDIPLVGTITGTISTNFTPPNLLGDHIHSVWLTNPEGHIVGTYFNTNVTAITGEPPETPVVALFNPVIMNLKVYREYNSNNVVWQAFINDDGDPALLNYEWSYSGSGASNFVDPAANPATLADYDETDSGTITFRVTDEDDGVTVLYYNLPANQFPNDPISSP